MAENKLNIIFHLFAFAVSAFATFYDFVVIKLGSDGFLGKFRFLTFWNICFQTVYFGMCVITDLTGTRTNPSQRGAIQRARDLFHACVAFPTTVFVVVSFWTIYFIDRELVYPKSLDAVFPMWLNHLLHTTILPFIVTEKFVSYHHYPRRLMGMLGAGFIASLYLLIVLMVAYIDNYWIYPILQVLSISQRAAFISVCVGVFAAFYVLGESVTSYIWGQGHQKSPKAGNRSKKGSKSV